MSSDTVMGTPAAAAAASSSSAAAASPASSSAPSAAAASSSSAAVTPALLDTLRENRFYFLPPQQFVDDLLNCAGDYTGAGCDEFEKGLVKNIIKKPKRAGEISKAVDAMYKDIEGRVKDSSAEFERKMYELLRIPSHVVTSNEMADQGALGLGRDTTKELKAERALEARLAALQQRVADADTLNRALKGELSALKADEEVYAAHEDAFYADKQTQAKRTKFVGQVEEFADSLAQLRPLHTAVTDQYGQVFGEEAAKDLKAHQARHAAAAAASSTESSAKAAASSSAAAATSMEEDAPADDDAEALF